MRLHAGIILGVLLIYSNATYSQYWMQRGGGLTVDEASAITTDGSSNTYTTGYFTFTATFENYAASSSGLEDIFILKTDATGNINWLKSAGGTDGDRALAVDADATGNIVVTGFYSTSATFDTQTIISAGQRDIFIAEYNSSGTLLWVVSAGGVNSDAGNSVSFDNSGNVIVTGEFSGSCTFGTTTLISQNSSIDVFTAKYDSNGNFLWVKQGSGNNTDRGTGVSSDSADNIYVTGIFSDTITFDQVHYNTVFSSVFLIKYDPSGQEQWFRWLGSSSFIDAGGISVHGNDINLTGSFGNAVYFYGSAGNPSLVGTYFDNIFICRYDLSGNLIWKHGDGSASPVTSKAIAVNLNGEVTITGNFKCRLSDFSAQYGSGTFCSLGYWDTYVSSYDNNGNWLWARNFGGHQDDFANGITVSPNGNISAAGSFQERFFSTLDLSTYINHGLFQLDYAPYASTNPPYCSDPGYQNFIYLFSYGNSDVFINSNINLNRQPYDFFVRGGSGCSRPYIPVCLASCQDTIHICGGTGLKADLGNYYDPSIQNNISPLYHFQWNTGDTSQSISFNGNGYCTVQVSTDDGCFVDADSVYVVNSPSPPDPAISDSKGINVNTTFLVDIPFCSFPDSVQLTCMNVGTNSVEWAGFPVGQNPVTVDTTGNYKCILTNQFGCTSFNTVKIITGSPFPPLVPEMICLSDSDHNDTIEVCLGSTFIMYVFDTLTNPGPLNDTSCIPGMVSASWNTSFNSNVLYNNLTFCSIVPNGFTCTQVDSFLIDVTAIINRVNPCFVDTFVVHKQIYVIVHPSPSGSLTFSITGPQYMCPGDSVTLVATPPVYNYAWTNGTQNDSNIVTQPGTYGAVASQTLTNSYGCSTVIYDYKTFNVQPYPQPVLTMAPINGIVCPGDSVYLMSSGTGTILSWQGPNGSFGANEQNVFVQTPGSYYYIMEVSPGCVFVSNTLQIIPYSTPALLALPGTSLCLYDSVTLQIVTDSLGSWILWDPPFNDNLLTHVVDSPGTYSCIVDQCLIISQLSITVTQDTAEAIIYSSSGGNTFCNGDSVLLTANPGMASYEWLPQGIFADSIYISQAGSYSLVTTSAGGCMDSAQVTITSTPNNLSPPLINDTSVCSGYSVLLNAISSDSVFWSYLPSYTGWFHNGNFYQTPQLQNPVTYYLFTQSGVCHSALDSVSISINPDSAIAVINSSVTTVCSGDSILLTANNGMIIYEWLPQGIFSDSIYVTQTGIYSLVTTSSSGCSDTASINITVTPNTLSPPVINDTSVCPGYSILLNALSNDSIYWNSVASYSGWFYSGNSYQAPPLQNAVTYYLFTQSGICRSAIDSVTIGITTDTAIAIINSSALTVCSGDSILLTANAGMALYQWLPPGIFSDSLYVFQTGNYSLITTSSAGCMDTAQISVTIVPNTLLPPVINDTVVCSGNSILLQALSNDSIYWNSVPSYSGWFYTGNFYQTPNLQNAVTYYLFTQAGVCRSVIDSVTIGISTDTAIAIINSSASAVCDGDSVLLTANNGMSSYEWLPQGIFSDSVYVTQTGSYSLVTLSSSGCSDTAEVAITILPNSLLPPVIQDTIICPGSSVLLHASSSDSIYWNAVASYTGWFNASSFYQTPPLQNSVTYYLFTQSGVCRSSMDSVMIIIDDGCDTLIIPNVFTPNGDGINELFPGIPGDYTIDLIIYNRWGNVIYNKQNQHTGWGGNYEDGHPAPEGTYYFLITVNYLNGKIQKQNGFVMLIRE